MERRREKKRGMQGGGDILCSGSQDCDAKAVVAKSASARSVEVVDVQRMIA